MEIRKSHKLDANGRSLLTRRTFMGELALGAATLTSMPIISVHSELPRDHDGARFAGTRSSGVVSFHMDQPYLDATGNAMPYHRSSGTRSGEPVAHLSEDAFRRIHYYV
jgi:hypothetical protein